MVEKERRYPNPEFSSPEEEEEYWRTHSPLEEGYKGKVQRSHQKRSSFLTVRLTGEELTRLRDIAAKRGLGPSSFARIILTSAIGLEGRSSKTITLDELVDTFERSLSQSERDKTKTLLNDLAVGEPDNPSLLVILPSRIRELEEHFLRFLKALGFSVIAPEDARHEKIREALKLDN